MHASQPEESPVSPVPADGEGHAHGHGHGNAHEQPSGDVSPEDFWEKRYNESETIWSGNPNPVLVREATALTPGRALDLGCGEGADAIWLARQGWQVTAVDISPTALDRGRANAENEGVADRIDWQQHNLGTTFPAGEFDLVSAQFLQSPVALDRQRVLRRAASAVAHGGALLVVGHAAFPSWAGTPETVALPNPDEVLASIALDDAEWTAAITANESRPVTAPNGSPDTLIDSVVFVHRR